MSTILKNAKDRDDLPLPVRPQIPTCKRKQDVTYRGKLQIRLAARLGKLDWTGLLVRRQAGGRPQGRNKRAWQALFCLSASWGLVPGTFLKLLHFDPDSNDTICWNVKYTCIFTQFRPGVHLISFGHLGSLYAKAVDLERSETLRRKTDPNQE